MEDGVPSSSSVQQHQHQQQPCTSNDAQKRSKTLESLNRYIESQKTLLQRINSSLSYFQELDKAAVEDPHGVLDHISDPFHDEPGVLEKLEKLVGDVCSEEGKKDIASLDWNAVPSNSDTSSLRDITASLRLSCCSTVFPPLDLHPQSRPTPSSSKQHLLPSAPSPYPRPKDSQLLCLVRQERARIIDPILLQHTAFLATLPPDSDDEKRDQSPVNSRNKKSKHNGTAAAAAAIRPRGPGGLFVKRSAATSVSTSAASPIVETSFLPDVSLEARTKRVRRKSSRALAAEKCSSYTKDKTVCTALRRSSRSSRSSSVVSIVKKEVKLTIRIPPRPNLVSNIASQRRTPSASTQTTASSSAGASSLFADRNSHSPAPSILSQNGDTSLTAPSEPGILDDDCSMADPEENAVDEEIKDEPYSDIEFEEEPDDFIPSTRDGSYTNPAVSGKEKAATKHRSNGRGGSCMLSEAHPDTAKPPKNGKKKKTETFNQTWTVEEQHLLEKLLQEYPDGVSKRWSKISRAMGGRRNPRQVASRVQKYFAKLKKFGLDAN